MRRLCVADLLRLPVRLHGIPLGRPVDVLLDETATRIVGLELLCRDGARRFLPFVVAEIRADEIAVASALTLLDERDLAFYRARTRRIGDVGLSDPWLDERGYVHAAQTAA